MSMILQASYAMLACARIGVIHSVVFSGFSLKALKDRILDSQFKVVITTDEGVRGNRPTTLKINVDTSTLADPSVVQDLINNRTP